MIGLRFWVFLGWLAGFAAIGADLPRTYSSLDKPSSNEKTVPPGTLNFEDADLLQVLKVYQELSGRIVVRATTLPHVKISLETTHPLTRIKALQTLDTILAQNGVVMIPQGAEFIKAVPSAAAAQEAAPFCDFPPDQIPESGTYICYIVHVKHRVPRDIVALLQPLAKMPNSILASDADRIIILRDHASNVRRMVELLQRVDKAKPDEGQGK